MKETKRNSEMINGSKDINNSRKTGYIESVKTGSKNVGNRERNSVSDMRNTVTNQINDIESERHHVKRVINWLEDKDQRLTKAESILFEISKLAKHSMRCKSSPSEKAVSQDDINILIKEFDSFLKRYISAEEAMGEIFDDHFASMLSCDALRKLNEQSFSVHMTSDKNSLNKTICELNSTIRMVRKNQFELESCIDLLHDEYDKSYVKETNLLASISAISRSEQIEDEIEMILCESKG